MARKDGVACPAHAGWDIRRHRCELPGLAVYSNHDGCTGNGHLRRQLRRHRQAAHRAAQDGRGQPLSSHLDRAPRGGRHPHQAAGHQPPAADDPRPAHQRHRHVRRRGRAHHGDRAQGEHVLRPAHAQEGRRGARHRLAARATRSRWRCAPTHPSSPAPSSSTRTPSSSSARSTTPRRSSRASATSSRASSPDDFRTAEVTADEEAYLIDQDDEMMTTMTTTSTTTTTEDDDDEDDDEFDDRAGGPPQN